MDKQTAAKRAREDIIQLATSPIGQDTKHLEFSAERIKNRLFAAGASLQDAFPEGSAEEAQERLDAAVAHVHIVAANHTLSCIKNQTHGMKTRPQAEAKATMKAVAEHFKLASAHGMLLNAEDRNALKTAPERMQDARKTLGIADETPAQAAPQPPAYIFA